MSQSTLKMLSSIRRALTPNASHAEDQQFSGLTLDTSPTASRFLTRDPSPPSFSPIEASPKDIPLWTGQLSNGNNPIMAQDDSSPMDLSSDQDSLHGKHNETDDNLLEPVRAGGFISKPRDGVFLLDGPSDDRLQPRSDVAHPRDSLLPSAEPAQSTSKSYPTRRTPSPSKNQKKSDPRISSPRKHSQPATEDPQLGSALPSAESAQLRDTYEWGLQGLIVTRPSSSSHSSKIANKQSRGQSHDPQEAEHPTTTSEAAIAEPQQSAPAAAYDAETSTSSNARIPKRKHEEDPLEIKIKSVKKQRGKSKKEEGSTATVEQQVAIEDTKKKTKPKPAESFTNHVEQEDAVEDETSKKQGRPKKEEGFTQNAKSTRSSKDDVPAKRGRPKREAPPLTTGTGDPTEQNGEASKVSEKRGRSAKTAKPSQPIEAAGVPMAETPKKRGRPKKDEEATQGPVPQVAPTAETPKKRGRPKKDEEATPGAVPQIAPTADTPKKRGRPKKNEDTAEASEPQGSSHVETPKKRGRPKAVGQNEVPKTQAPGKRGRPKKNSAA